jgi:hypothetical protein
VLVNEEKKGKKLPDFSYRVQIFVARSARVIDATTAAIKLPVTCETLKIRSLINNNQTINGPSGFNLIVR